MQNNSGCCREDFSKLRPIYMALFGDQEGARRVLESPTQNGLVRMRIIALAAKLEDAANVEAVLILYSRLRKPC